MSTKVMALLGVRREILKESGITDAEINKTDKTISDCMDKHYNTRHKSIAQELNKQSTEEFFNV